MGGHFSLIYQQVLYSTLFVFQTSLFFVFRETSFRIKNDSVHYKIQLADRTSYDIFY